MRLVVVDEAVEEAVRVLLLAAQLVEAALVGSGGRLAGRCAAHHELGGQERGVLRGRLGGLCGRQRGGGSAAQGAEALEGEGLGGAGRGRGEERQRGDARVGVRQGQALVLGAGLAGGGGAGQAVDKALDGASAVARGGGRGGREGREPPAALLAGEGPREVAQGAGEGAFTVGVAVGALVDGVEGQAILLAVVVDAAERLRGGALHGVVEGRGVGVVGGSGGSLRTGSQTAMHWSVFRGVWRRCSVAVVQRCARCRPDPGGEGGLTPKRARVTAETTELQQQQGQQ